MKDSNIIRGDIIGTKDLREELKNVETFEPRRIDAEWILDPIQEAEMQEMMSKNPAFAEAILRPRTPLLMRSIQEKVRFREHVGIEIKGATRNNLIENCWKWKIYSWNSIM